MYDDAKFGCFYFVDGALKDEKYLTQQPNLGKSNHWSVNFSINQISWHIKIAKIPFSNIKKINYNDYQIGVVNLLPEKSENVNQIIRNAIKIPASK